MPRSSRTRGTSGSPRPFSRPRPSPVMHRGSRGGESCNAGCTSRGRRAGRVGAGRVGISSRDGDYLPTTIALVVVGRVLLRNDPPELRDELVRLWEFAGRELRVEYLTVVRDLEAVDRLHRLGEHVEPIHAACDHKLVLVHLSEPGRRWPAHHAEGLVAEEVQRGHAELRDAHRADGILHRR